MIQCVAGDPGHMARLPPAALAWQADAMTAKALLLIVLGAAAALGVVAGEPLHGCRHPAVMAMPSRH